MPRELLLWCLQILPDQGNQAQEAAEQGYLSVALEAPRPHRLLAGIDVQ